MGSVSNGFCCERLGNARRQQDWRRLTLYRLQTIVRLGTSDRVIVPCDGFPSSKCLFPTRWLLSWLYFYGDSSPGPSVAVIKYSPNTEWGISILVWRHNGRKASTRGGGEGFYYVAGIPRKIKILPIPWDTPAVPVLRGVPLDTR